MRTDNAPAGFFSSDIVNDACTKHNPASPEGVVAKDDNFDECACLLTRVDFKWLMAGQGWWIDPHRFQHDSFYANEVLRFALASQSRALRACAASLQTQLCEQVLH